MSSVSGRTHLHIPSKLGSVTQIFCPAIRRSISYRTFGYVGTSPPLSNRAKHKAPSCIDAGSGVQIERLGSLLLQRAVRGGIFIILLKGRSQPIGVS